MTSIVTMKRSSIVTLLLASCGGSVASFTPNMFNSGGRPTLSKSSPKIPNAEPILQPASGAKPAAIVKRKAHVALPVLSYASLGTVTLGAAKLIAPSLGTASVAALVGCVGLPMLLAASQVLMMGGAGVAKSMGGRRADDRIRRMADDAAAAVGVPPPAHVYQISAREPNAFAAGMSSRDATVAVTDGLTSILTDDELRAVLAHEMGHVRHDDVQRNMHVAIAAIGLGGIYEAGRLLLDTSGRTSRKKSGDSDGDSGRSLGLTLMAVGGGAQAVAHLLRLGASRCSELEADRAAAVAFGTETMIGALNKINRAARSHSGELRSKGVLGRAMGFAMISDGPSTPRQSAAPPKKAGGLGRWLGRAGQWLLGMTRTHPKIEDRVSALEALAAAGEAPRRPPGSFWGL